MQGGGHTPWDIIGHHVHTHSLLFPLSISSPPAGMFLGGGWKLENLDLSGHEEKVHRNLTQTETQAQDQTRTLEL